MMIKFLMSLLSSLWTKEAQQGFQILHYHTKAFLTLLDSFRDIKLTRSNNLKKILPWSLRIKGAGCAIGFQDLGKWEYFDC